jgi:hypothetical protein
LAATSRLNKDYLQAGYLFGLRSERQFVRAIEVNVA